MRKYGLKNYQIWGDSEGKRLLKYVEDRIKEIKRQKLQYVVYGS